MKVYSENMVGDLTESAYKDGLSMGIIMGGIMTGVFFLMYSLW